MTTMTRPAGQATHYEPIRAARAIPQPRYFHVDDTADLGHPSIDPVAFERLLNGEPAPGATEAEQYYAARWLYRIGQATRDEELANKKIAKRVGVTDRSVQRWSDDGWVDREFAPNGGQRRREVTDTLEERWASKTRATDGGHLTWTGALDGGRVPSFNHRGRRYQGTRVAYRIKHGRDPEGSARPNCGVDLCVLPDHIADINIAATKKQAVTA